MAARAAETENTVYFLAGEKRFTVGLVYWFLLGGERFHTLFQRCPSKIITCSASEGELQTVAGRLQIVFGEFW